MTLKHLMRHWIQCDDCGREDAAARKAELVSGPKAIDSALAQGWRPKDRPIEHKGLLLFLDIKWTCDRCQGNPGSRVDLEKEAWLMEQFKRTKDLPRPRCKSCIYFTPPHEGLGPGVCEVLFVADTNSTTLLPGSIGHGGYFHMPVRPYGDFGCAHHVEKEEP